MIKLKNLLLEVINNILIIDVESTCGEDISEIIEIGMADTNDISYPSIIIMPEFSNVTPLCTSLTTLTPEQINKEGQPIQQAYLKFNSIVSKYSTWASYGEYDKRMFEKMSSLYDININLPPQHINVRSLVSQKIHNSPNPQLSPKNPKDSLELLGYKFIGINHRGDDDAKNIARLYNILNTM
jgi:inhibitor of KinA sporulation pathway (predicted exonuclease)